MPGIMRDRECWLEPGQVLRHAWIPIRQCVRGSDHRLACGDVERKYQELLQMGGRQPTPAPVGHWDGDWFIVEDGNHTYAALLQLGARKMLVSWVEDAPRKVGCPECGFKHVDTSGNDTWTKQPHVCP